MKCPSISNTNQFTSFLDCLSYTTISVLLLSFVSHHVINATVKYIFNEHALLFFFFVFTEIKLWQRKVLKLHFYFEMAIENLFKWQPIFLLSKSVQVV